MIQKISALLFCLVGMLAVQAAETARLRFSPERAQLTATTNLQITLIGAPADARILFTTDGSVPSPTNGQVWKEGMPLNKSTVIRAVGYGANGRITSVETHSYLRLDLVSEQDGADFPKNWGLRENKPVQAHYRLASSREGLPAADAADLQKGLAAIPSVSIVMDPKELFGSERGIYAHPMEHGNEWERSCSMELLDPVRGRRAQVGAGIRIQGGWNRRPEECPKHSFRLLFKKAYGPDEWNFPLFEEKGPASFNGLILRGGCNNTWLHWSSEERRRGDFIRDQWMRDAYARMGHVSARGFFVHLYLNGLYWGLYNLAERPDAAFAASHLGGKKSEYDSRNGENLLSGDAVAWKELFDLVNRGVESDADWEAVKSRLDVNAFADYMLLNCYGANGDWDRVSNWYAARRRNPSGRFLFFVWDGERTLEGISDNTLSTDDDKCPTRLFQKLRGNPQFRKLFAERIQLHLLSPGGALAAAQAAPAFQRWSAPLDAAVVAESARWGNYRRDIHSYKTPPYEFYTRTEHWRPEIARLLGEYFKARPGELLKQFQSAKLYP